MKPLRYHPSGQRDIHEAMRYFLGDASETVALRIWKELSAAFESIRSNPTAFHFDVSGLRRCHLRTFPYHVLYQNLEDRVRVQVVRHNARHPGFGTRR